MQPLIEELFNEYRETAENVARAGASYSEEGGDARDGRRSRSDLCVGSWDSSQSVSDSVVCVSRSAYVRV